MVPTCLQEALNCSTTAYYQKQLVRDLDFFLKDSKKKKKLTALESDMSKRNLQNHRAFVLSIIYTRLATEVRIRHLGLLETHETEVLS